MPRPVDIDRKLVSDRALAAIVDKVERGERLSPDDGVLAIGSGGSYALAAARALITHTQLSARDIATEAMRIAGEICIYSNTNIVVEELEG